MYAGALDAGGCTVLAHPVFIGVSDACLGELLDIFIELGLDGVEAHSSGTSNDGIDRYITMARRRDLIVTGGSDFHQPIKGGVEMGKGRGNLKIPYRCVEEIREGPRKEDSQHVTLRKEALKKMLCLSFSGPFVL